MREQQRLRMLTVMAIVVVVLGALPLYLLIQAANRDPVFTSLDALQVPGWAVGASEDQVAGSRWCVVECRFRERDIASEKAPEETNAAYVKALEDAGWTRWKPAAGCPLDKVDGHYSCWRRDEYTLDLWVRNKPCSDELQRNRPSTAPDPSAPAVPMGKDECGGSMVSFKVYNAIADERLTQPDQAPPSAAP
jgi:integrin beta 3